MTHYNENTNSNIYQDTIPFRCLTNQTLDSSNALHVDLHVLCVPGGSRILTPTDISPLTFRPGEKCK